MKTSNISLVTALLVTCFGHVLAWCDCDYTSCSNIHVCYNCETSMDSDCLQTYTGVDKDTCRNHLTTSSNIKASYVQATEECSLSRADCGPWHSASNDIIFMKTCDTGCSNYTFTILDNYAVTFGAGSYTFYQHMYMAYWCLGLCLPPSQDCTTSYDSYNNYCYVYETSCGGSCATQFSSFSTVYTVTCNSADCPVLTGPSDGVVDTSAGVTSGDQAIYSCNAGYTLSGSSVTTCGSDGNWDNSAPTCQPVDCGSLSGPTNGSVRYSTTTYGSQATYTCNTGYTISGSSVRTCDSDGNWDNSAPICQPVNCGSISDPTDGNVIYSTTTYGSQATYTCNTGYTISGSSVRSCESDGNWDNSAPICQPVNCGSISDPTNGNVIYSTTTYGSQATYTCNTGYTISGSSVRTCDSDGNWDNSVPICQPVNCGSISDPTDGNVIYSTTTYGSQATYTCNTGYTISGSSVRSCESDGNWDNSAPICQPVNCGSISDPTDGNVIYSTTTYGSQATYNCNTGYTISGSSVRSCESDGNWDNSAPICQPVNCGSISDPTDGNVTYSTTTYGSQATYNCNTGYTISGSSVRTCDSDGNWDNSAPTCQPVNCGSISNPTDGNVTYSTTTYGSQATYNCNTGYTISGSSVRTCDSDGNWDNSAPICQPVNCGSISDPTDGNVTYSTTTYGSQATYNCNTGYTISGSSVRTCDSDGNWDNSAPTCQPVDCGSISDPTDGNVTYSTTTYGSQASYNCNTGYTIGGSSVRTCDSDGNWDNALPTCHPVDCGSLSNPLFGIVAYIETTYGARANYTCNSGYSLSGSNFRICLSNGTWELTEPECVSADCGPLTHPVNGSVHTPAGTTFGKTATFSCDVGYTLSNAAPRICQATSSWTGNSPTCNLAGVTTTAAPEPGNLYIMPCICYTNKTFVNLTQEEIIQQLIADTKIDTKETTLALYKLKSRSDPRMSSKMIGVVAIVVLSVMGGLIIGLDLVTIRSSIANSKT